MSEFFWDVFRTDRFMFVGFFVLREREKKKKVVGKRMTVYRCYYVSQD